MVSKQDLNLYFKDAQGIEMRFLSMDGQDGPTMQTREVS